MATYISFMRNTVILCVLALGLTVAAPVARAQDSTEQDTFRRGLEQLLDGLEDRMGDRLIELQDLADQIGPALRDFVEEMGPALTEMLGEVEDWSRYEPPEILPNGDIIIRRKPDPAPNPAPDVPGHDEDAAPVPIEI